MFFQMASGQDPMRELRNFVRRLEGVGRSVPTESDQRRAAQLLLGRGETRPRLPLTRTLSQRDAEKMVAPAAPPGRDSARDRSEPYTEEELELGRLIYAESLGVLQDFPAVGSVVVNRLRSGKYGATVWDVIHQDNQFEVVREGNPRGRDSVHWTRFGQPEGLTRQERKRRDLALETAREVLAGKIPDPTGGATHFLAPGADSAWFQDSVNDRRLVPSPYSSGERGHIFYRVNPQTDGR